MEINRTYSISTHNTNRYWSLAREIDERFKIPRGQLMGLFRRKGIDKCDEIFRKVVKEDADNGAALFLYLLGKIPSKQFPKKKKQLKLKLK
jgi:hypothetical protein